MNTIFKSWGLLFIRTQVSTPSLNLNFKLKVDGPPGLERSRALGTYLPTQVVIIYIGTCSRLPNFWQAIFSFQLQIRSF
jgi:hypothetical protein